MSNILIMPTRHGFKKGDVVETYSIFNPDVVTKHKVVSRRNMTTVEIFPLDAWESNHQFEVVFWCLVSVSAGIALLISLL